MQSSPVCTVKLLFVAIFTGETITVAFDNLTIRYNVTHYNNTGLVSNQYYNLTVEASNTNGTSISYVALSKFLQFSVLRIKPIIIL